MSFVHMLACKGRHTARYTSPVSVADGYRNGDQRHANGPMWLVMATLLVRVSIG